MTENTVTIKIAGQARTFDLSEHLYNSNPEFAVLEKVALATIGRGTARYTVDISFRLINGTWKQLGTVCRNRTAYLSAWADAGATNSRNNRRV